MKKITCLLLVFIYQLSIIAADRPNVVFILTDDQRGDAVGYHPNSLLGIKTPSIDKIAAEGARYGD